MDSNFEQFKSDIGKHVAWLKVENVVKCIRADAGGKPILLGLDDIISAFRSAIAVDSQKVGRYPSFMSLSYT